MEKTNLKSKRNRRLRDQQVRIKNGSMLDLKDWLTKKVANATSYLLRQPIQQSVAAEMDESLLEPSFIEDFLGAVRVSDTLLHSG